MYDDIMAHAYTTKGYNKTVVAKKHSFLVDGAIFIGIMFVVYMVINIANAYQTPFNQHFSIDLSLTSLPHYALLSVGRMLLAYVISLLFSLIYARIAVLNKTTEGILIPILDVLQSIPILSFMPGVVLGLVALFPNSNIGLELAAVVLIFTSQAWNITFGFYQTLLTVPDDLKEVSLINHLGFWQRFTRLEVPAGMISIIWNSMMSWAGGWFFLMASEQFTLGSRSYQLPGLGSYLQEAANKGNILALVAGLATLIIVIVLLDQLVWRPLVAWGDKFKIEQDESDERPHSWVLSLIEKSRLIAFLNERIDAPISGAVDRLFSYLTRERKHIVKKARTVSNTSGVSSERIMQLLGIVLMCCLVVTALVGGVGIVTKLNSHEWNMIVTGALATIARTATALVISLLWTVPVGVSIGMNPKLAKKLQPIVQMAASIPATALFPALLLVLLTIPSGLTIAAVILMLLGTQWYVLFNVIAGAMAIPNDLKEATKIYHITGWKKWKILILPAIFPYLVTGMITATGGAWNASIVAEYVTFAGKVHRTIGLGADIASAANTGNFNLLLASTITMAVIVFCINRFGWQRIYRLAENRFHVE